MFIIVLNHYVSRRGIVEVYDGFNFNNNAGHLFRSTGYPALVAFVLISGYFMAGDGKFRSGRILAVLVQVVAFSLVSLVIAVSVLGIRLDADKVIKSVIPYLYGYDAYWFVGPYLGMCMLAPFMDMLMDSLDIRQYSLFLLMSVILVFLIPTYRAFSMSNEKNGILTFMVVYMIAGFIKKFRLEDEFSKTKLVLVITGFLVLSYSMYPLGHLLKAELYNNIILDMNNMFSLVIGVCFFLLFLKIHVNTNRFINYIAGTTFGIYLFHENFILREWIWGTAVDRAAYYGSSKFLLHCFLTVSALFMAGVIFDIIIGYMIKPVLGSGKINALCSWIDQKFNSSFKTA
jgi:hypothetical protein